MYFVGRIVEHQPFGLAAQIGFSTWVTNKPNGDTMDNQIDFSRFTGRTENEEVARQLDPMRELRTPVEKESSPDYFRRGQEREGKSEWSGGSMGGGTWAGRSR
jgi:hypothetical protein